MSNERIFNCFCGISMLGVEDNYSQHLTYSCPVYAAAFKALSLKYVG